jgi:peptidoglycan glycosyltransferase
MNRQIRLLGFGIIILFVALFLQLNWLQLVHAPALEANPLNGRAIVKEYTAKRGDIVSADGTTLATSIPTNDQFKYLRQYPTGALFAQITGYFSFTYGADGAERTYDRVLTGKSSPFKLPTSLSQLRNLLAKRDQSQSITLTVLDKLQKVAETQLTGRDGSVVALDPRTGAILAMYSNPSFDPNLLSGHDQAQVEANYKALVAQPGGVLAPGAYRQRFFPGSTFKIVTSGAVYDHKPALATKVYPTLSALPLPQTTNELHNFGGESCGGQLPELFTVSCDTGFGQIGLDLGGVPLSAEAVGFGFNQTPPIDLPFPAQSTFPSAVSFVQDQPGLAYSAVGQQNVQATPLSMAMVAGAVANGGTVMTPHILGHVTNSQNQVVSTYQPKPWLHVTSKATANQLKALMVSVVNSPQGTGTAAQIPGVQVAGKTGTAQTGTGKVDVWFVAFAPAAAPTIAVAVMLPNQPPENEFTGGTVAAPIAKALIEAYLSTPGASS